MKFNRFANPYYSEFQEREFTLQKDGFKAVKHQSFVGTSYLGAVQNAVTNRISSTVAMKDSTETTQF